MAEGVELLGAYEDSGLKEPPYLVRRPDGQVVQLTRLLYLVASLADGRRTVDQIAELVGRESGRIVTGENVEFLANEKLRPLGILEHTDGSTTPDLARAAPLLALTFRAPLLPERAVGAVANLLRPLFLPPVVVAVVLGLVALDSWLFFAQGLGEGVREILYRPELFLLLFGLTALSGVFHEFGHVAACRYGGARPGAIGVGIYLVWPVFYADVTDTYRLGRRGRLRTDLGGDYFNAIFSLLIAAVYFATGAEPLLVVILLQQIEILHQFLPFLMLDGYYVVSDLTGVPNLFGRIKPILRSMLPGRGPDERVSELKPWVRTVVTVWVLMVVPVLLGLFGMLALNAPMIVATTWNSAAVHYAEAREAFGLGGIVTGLAEVLRLVLLVVPLVGTLLVFALVGKRLGSALLRWPRSRYGVRARNETLVSSYFTNLLGGADPGSVGQLLARDCILHRAGAPNEVRGIEGTSHYIDNFRDALPQDARLTLQSKVLEGNMVVARWTYDGARDGNAAPQATGDEASTRVTSFRIAGGKIAEIWDGFDVLGGSRPANRSEDGPETLPSSRVIVGAVGAYILVPAVLLYPVGLLALELQLQISQHLEFLTAWYAVSLVPTTIIWGQATTILLLPLCTGLAVALALAHFRVWRLESRERARQAQYAPRRQRYRARLGVCGFVLSLAAMSVIVLWFVPVPFLGGFAVTLSLTVAVLIGCWGGTFIGNDYMGRADKPESTVPLGKRWIWRGVEERWVLRGLLWTYLGSVLGAIISVLAVAAFGLGPDLPRVLMGTTSGGTGASDEAPPYLLSHSGGYWHVLYSREDEEPGNIGNATDTLVSIPDGEAGHVQVIDDPVADLDLTVVGPREEVAWVDTMMTYKLKVTNNGPDLATAVEIRTRIPEAARLASVSASQGTCTGNVAHRASSVECELGNLDEEDAATVRIEVEPEVAGRLSSTVGSRSDGYDYDEENSKGAFSVEVKPDAVAPETRPTINPMPNPRRWTNREVTVSLEANDRQGSGVERMIYGASGAKEIQERTVADASEEFHLNSEGKTTIYYAATDAAGNTEKRGSVTLGIDKTKPDVECGAPDDLWHKGEVSIHCTASDSLSGLADAADADFYLSTRHATERVDDGEQDVSVSTNSREVCDAAGNCSKAGPLAGIKIDKKRPAIEVVMPPDEAEYKLGEHVRTDYVCSDGGSGVKACHGSVPRGTSLDTSSIGSKRFSVKAEDGAGNTTYESSRYEVVYDFSGYGPVRFSENARTLYVVEAGKAVLVEFGLGRYRGPDVFAPSYPRSREISCSGHGPRISIPESATQFTKKSDSDRYAFAWNTDESWAGTCRQLMFKLNDGTDHLAAFEFSR